MPLQHSQDGRTPRGKKVYELWATHQDHDPWDDSWLTDPR